MAAKREKQRSTMEDVAELAGVSQTTVSFVINDTPGVSISDETRERVWAAVEELGYRPNVLARGLRKQSSGILGFISDEIATTPHAVSIVEGAQDAAWEREKILVLVNTKRDRNMEEAAIELLLQHQVEGIVYATMYHRPVDLPEALREVPTVLLDCFSENGAYASVVPDEVGGGRKATEVLLAKGHRRVGFINNVDPIPATSGRLEGYRSALADHDVPFDDALVCSELAGSGGGYRGTLELMRVTDPPTAIFCFNDRMAMGAYDALRQLDLSIPDDVAVMGFDNQETIAAHLYPPLSTMALPHYEMGEWAVSHLLEQLLVSDEVKPARHMITCRFIDRASI